VFERWCDWLLERGVLAAREAAIGPGPRWGAALDWHGGARGAALRGRVAALAEIMFGRSEAITLLMDDHLSPEALLGADAANAAAVAGLARRLADIGAALGRPLRVAEIGARSGHSAAQLLARLPAEAIDYTLFDGSAALLGRAKTRLRGLPHGVEFHRVDPAYLPWEQLHAFDAVVANNSLHRFDDPAAGLALAALLLAPGGVLLALESATASPLALLSAALLEAPAAEGRDGARLRARAEWQAALARGAWQDGRVDGDGAVLSLFARQPLDVATPDQAGLRAWLARRLPAHQLPENILPLARLPLNANAKLDRRAVRELAQRHGIDTTGDLAPPQGALELHLAAIWCHVLGLDKVGREQSFFAVGGDSLSATRLVESIRRQLPVELTLRQLFSSPTIAGLAAVLGPEQNAIDIDQDTEEGSL
jgi:yersiniabactin nonribosomal peptide synthetase